MGEHDLDRREFLKRGAIGGALVWATPVIQLVGMRPALAQVASPACNVWYAVKIDVETGVLQCTSIHDQGAGDEGFGTGKCLDVEGLLGVGGAEDGGCSHINGTNITTLEEHRWVVQFPSDCQFVHDSGYCSTKTGSGCLEGTCTWDPETWTLTFTVNPVPGNGISHIEFAFCCED
jgi:hypothetical protein